MEQVAKLDEKQYEEIWEAAAAYNQMRAGNKQTYLLNESETKSYEELLNVGGNGIMGYLEIPKIDCYLPIYHGTGESVLQVAIGHLEWSSLPVGGEGTHCILSGHRGLPSAKLLTDLDKMAEGDIFTFCVLEEILTS